MGKTSVKENKNEYQLAREELELSRERASERLQYISEDKLYKIESEIAVPHPSEVIRMAEVYQKPTLCNYYCAHQCDIGKKYVPEIEVKDISQIVLEMLNSLNKANNMKDRLMDITVDGVIDETEINDFVKIQKELEKISITVETLQLWSEKMIATGKIDKNKYEQFVDNLSEE